MQSYNHFTLSERIRLQQEMDQGKSLRCIAREMGRNASSISREIKRNANRDGQYHAAMACRRYLVRRRLCNAPYRLERDEILSAFVAQKLKRYWSPETIVALWKRDHPNARLSHATLYRGLRRGMFPGCCAKEVLRRRGKRKYHRVQDKRFFSVKPERSVHDWPPAIEARARIGDWEGDTLVGKNQQSHLTTLVDRKSRYLVAAPVVSSNASKVKEAIAQALYGLPVTSITFDNGPEFSAYRELEQRFDMLVYFADPRSPWQRGSNENLNGALRFFFPKGSDFLQMSPSQIQAAVELLNDRPRKCLDWLTPREVFFSQCCT